MTKIEFQLNEVIIAEHKATQFFEEDPSFIVMTYFLTPIRIEINSIELFERVSVEKDVIERKWIKTSDGKFTDNRNIVSPWLKMPLIGFAMEGESKIRQACLGNSNRFYLPDIGGYLDLTSVSNRLLNIYSSINKSSTNVECEEIIKEFSIFVNQVKKQLNEKIPEIRKNPYIDHWIEN